MNKESIAKAVFFDRDGVLNKDKHYLFRIADMEWIPGAREALAWLHTHGWKIIVVTNQSGVARGYYTEEDVHRLHDFMASEAEKAGGVIDDFFYCPHLKGAPVKAYDKDCSCRKPAPGMILQAMKKHRLLPAECFLIGDGARDVEAARRAGIQGFLFTSVRLDDFLQACLKQRNMGKEIHG